MRQRNKEPVGMLQPAEHLNPESQGESKDIIVKSMLKVQQKNVVAFVHTSPKCIQISI